MWDSPMTTGENAPWCSLLLNAASVSDEYNTAEQGCRTLLCPIEEEVAGVYDSDTPILDSSVLPSSKLSV